MSTISNVVDNYAIFAIATFIACVLVALIVKRLSGSAHKTVTPAPVSEREGNRAGSSEEGGGDGDGEHDRNKQTYMELFASKIVSSHCAACCTLLTTIMSLPAPDIDRSLLPLIFYWKCLYPICIANVLTLCTSCTVSEQYQGEHSS
jgi:hypothetical protein